MLHNALLVKGELVVCANASVCETSCALRCREHSQPWRTFYFYRNVGTIHSPISNLFGWVLSFECDCSSQCWTCDFSFLTAFFLLYFTGMAPVTLFRIVLQFPPLSQRMPPRLSTSMMISQLKSHYQSRDVAWPLHRPGLCWDPCVCLCMLGSVSRQSPRACYVTMLLPQL